VLLTTPLRNILRWGYEMQQQSPAHLTVKRLAAKAMVPQHVLGSACNVRGFSEPPAFIELDHFMRILEVIADV
jgi:hypothetical protein